MSVILKSQLSFINSLSNFYTIEGNFSKFAFFYDNVFTKFLPKTIFRKSQNRILIKLFENRHGMVHYDS